MRRKGGTIVENLFNINYVIIIGNVLLTEEDVSDEISLARLAAPWVFVFSEEVFPFLDYIIQTRCQKR